MAEKGKVKHYDKEKCGFVIALRGGREVFVHHTAMIAESANGLRDGDMVTLDVVEGPKGLQAKNVVKVS